MIDSTKFGSITIGGKTYESDVIVTWEWKVKEAKTETRHAIAEQDFCNLLFERPDVVVIGTGQSGEMKVSKGVEKFARKKKIMMIAAETPEAIERFNQLAEAGKHAVAYMHVTC